jgi:GTPase involved in cell partitioning and DNA repair
MFVDRVKAFAQAGNGGRGSVSFRREKFVPKGGPDGGDGGRGGDVILRADRHVDNLANLFYEPIIKAKNWRARDGKKCGRSGATKIVKVPVGTIVYAVEGAQRSTFNAQRSTPNAEQSGIPIVDLIRDGAKNSCFVAAEQGVKVCAFQELAQPRTAIHGG